MDSVIEYDVILTDTAQKFLTQIKDIREQQLIVKRLEKLKQEPDKQGKALSKELIGYRSVRAVGQRYRIVYKIKQDCWLSLSESDAEKKGIKKMFIKLQINY